MAAVADVDPDLVARAIARDPAAVRELIRAVGPVIQGRVVKGLSRRRTGAHAGRSVSDEAEDITQEVFLALFDDDARALRAWDPARAPLGAFVALIADHQVFSIFRSGRRRPWSDELVAVEDPDAMDGAATSPEAQVSSAEQLDALLDAMRASLTPKGFDLFVRLYVQEQSTEAVCADLALTPDAVYAWRSRLAKHVRRVAAELAAGDASGSGPHRSTNPVEGHAR